MLRCQILLDALDISFRLVDLVQRHNQRHLRSLGVMNRLGSLRHHAVISCHDKNDQIGDLGTTCTHRRKGFVAWRVEEGNHAARRLYVICADVLGNAACLASRHFGATDVIKQ